jgi:hypothetical protein
VCKKHKIDVKRLLIGSPLLFIGVGSLIVCVIESEPLASIRNAYCKLGATLQIVKV